MRRITIDAAGVLMLRDACTIAIWTTDRDIRLPWHLAPFHRGLPMTYGFSRSASETSYCIRS